MTRLTPTAEASVPREARWAPSSPARGEGVWKRRLISSARGRVRVIRNLLGGICEARGKGYCTGRAGSGEAINTNGSAPDPAGWRKGTVDYGTYPPAPVPPIP